MFFFKKPPRHSEAELMNIRDRARSIHDLIGQDEMSLAEIFAMMGEEDRPPRRPKTVDPGATERLLPGQVPQRRQQ
jgi:hypothetical protein